MPQACASTGDKANGRHNSLFLFTVSKSGREREREIEMLGGEGTLGPRRKGVEVAQKDGT